MAEADHRLQQTTDPSPGLYNDRSYHDLAHRNARQAVSNSCAQGLKLAQFSARDISLLAGFCGWCSERARRRSRRFPCIRTCSGIR